MDRKSLNSAEEVLAWSGDPPLRNTGQERHLGARSGVACLLSRLRFPSSLCGLFGLVAQSCQTLQPHGQRSLAGSGPWGRLQCPSRRGQGGRHGTLVDHLGGHAAGTAPRPGLTQSRPVTASYTAFLILRRQQAGPRLLGQFSDGISCVPAWGAGAAGRGRWTDCPWSVRSHLIFSHSSHSTDPVVF